VDSEAGGLILLEASWHKSGLQALIFIKNVLRLCRSRPMFVVDRRAMVSMGFKLLTSPI